MTESPEWAERRRRRRYLTAGIWKDLDDSTTYIDDSLEVRGDVTANGVLLGTGGGPHPDLATHDALGLSTDAELAAHAAAGDPHTVYATNAELDLHTGDTVDAHDASAVSILDLAGTFDAVEVEAALAELTSDDVAHAALPNIHHAEFTSAQHTAIGDGAPHHAAAHAINGANHTGTLDDAQIPASIARDSEVSSAVSTHEGAVDPHTGYQKESEKGAASGYASLDVGGTVPDAQIASTIARLADVIAKAIVDAKGDLIVATAADTVSRLAVGADGQVPIADSTQATGMRWGSAPAGGAPAFTTTEVSVGSSPDAKRAGRFTIATAGQTAGKAVFVRQASGPYTGKGTRSDEAEMDVLNVTGKVLDATTIECFWQSVYRVRGNYKFDWLVSG